MKKTLLPLVASILFSVRVAGQDTLTVEQAVQTALASNPAVAQARANAEAAGARASLTASQRYPSVSAEAAAVHINPAPAITVPGMGTFRMVPEDNYDAHVSARVTLFDFGRTGTAVDLSRARAESAFESVELTRRGLACQTIRTFYSLLFLEKSARVQDEQIGALNGHLEATLKRVNAGSATDLDALTTRVRVAAARSQKVEIENALQKQRTFFRQLLELPADAPVAVRGEFDPDTTAVHIDSLVQSARGKRAELAIARKAEESARLQKRIALLGRLPSLKVSASYGSKNGYFPDLDAMTANWTAGVRAEMPVWEGGRIERQVDEAKAQLAAERAHLRDVERQIRSEIEQAASDLEAALARIRISDVQLQQAYEAAAYARSKYETGSVTNLDLLDAEAAESGARLAVLQSRYRAVISRMELQRASGGKLMGE